MSSLYGHTQFNLFVVFSFLLVNTQNNFESSTHQTYRIWGKRNEEPRHRVAFTWCSAMLVVLLWSAVLPQVLETTWSATAKASKDFWGPSGPSQTSLLRMPRPLLAYVSTKTTGSRFLSRNSIVALHTALSRIALEILATSCLHKSYLYA